ncbi:MAG TPA: 30S ribosomal protein S6 [Desulfomicrobiaceae bacterium]|jgi:small subunit ribosomal protein S6|nr:30S ribosomal protein S6 [Desulfomicrobiaceae bacterium]
MVNKYEVLLLLSPELGSEGRQEILNTLTGIIERDGGNMLLVDDWGIRDLAYPVQKMTRGYYVRLELALPGEAVSELERIIRITDGIFKFVTVKLADKYVPEEA